MKKDMSTGRGLYRQRDRTGSNKEVKERVAEKFPADTTLWEKQHRSVQGLHEQK